MAAHANERRKRNQLYQRLRAFDMTSCNRRVVNGLIRLRLGVESMIVAHDKLPSILAHILK